MKKKILIAMLLSIVSIIKINAQNFTGYRSSNYTGVNSVFFNPANIADSRYQWDLNLFSVNGFAGNNKATFKLSDISSTTSEKIKNNFLGGNGNSNANINAEILGPSVMFNLNHKSAMAITTRARVVSNLKDFDGNLINAALNNTNANFPYSLNSNSNSRIITNGWAEIGVSYAREIASHGPHYFKAGVTLKYLSGAGNNYFQINQINTTVNVDLIAQQAYLQNTTGSFNIGTTTNNLNNLSFNSLFNGNAGIGGDLGVVYEYRPKYANAKVGDQISNKYKLKIGVSILDIGAIRYTSIANSSASYIANISGNNRFGLDQVINKSFATIKTVLDSYPQYFTNTSSGSNSYNAGLPTVIQTDVDYHLNRGFYINVGGQLNMVSKSNLYTSSQYNNLTLTPRFEGKSFGIYFPLNYSELTKFNAGISFRAGPLFIGSGSLFTAIANSKQADVHVGLHIGFLHKVKKAPKLKEEVKVITPELKMVQKPDTDGDGIFDDVDKCPTVAGIAKYQGCPIPDTDGDGINDETDKCPTVAGIAKYQGCPIPDTDGDGINDEEDKCPTISGPISNFGCPVIEKAIKDKINFAASKIFFELGSIKLVTNSFKALDGVATLLKADSSFKMDIDGYTDNLGNVAKNLALSEQRAANVKKYLVSKGVAENNLISTGHGIEKPIANNKTAAGRSKNRRVELTVRNY